MSKCIRSVVDEKFRATNQYICTIYIRVKKFSISKVLFYLVDFKSKQLIEFNIKPSRILTNPTLTGIKIQQFKAKVVIEKQRKFTLINYDPLKICDKNIKQQHPLSLTKSKAIFTDSDINELVNHQLQLIMRIIPNENKILNLIQVENKIKVIEITPYQDSLAISKKGLIFGKSATKLNEKGALSVFIKN